MKNSYNPQEEISDISQRLTELAETYEKRIKALEEMVISMEKLLKDMATKSAYFERGQHRLGTKIDNIEGTIGKTFPSIGDTTKWTKQ
jgi:septation ring formation regulator EzrA